MSLPGEILRCGVNMPCSLYPTAVNVKTQVEMEPLSAGALGDLQVPSARPTSVDRKYGREINMRVHVCVCVCMLRHASHVCTCAGVCTCVC